MKININEYVKFKLTKHGKEVLMDWVKDSFSLYKDNNMLKDRSYKQISKFFVKTLKNDWSEAQFWQFMNIFGDKIDSAEPIIKNNLLKIENDNG